MPQEKFESLADADRRHGRLLVAYKDRSAEHDRERRTWTRERDGMLKDRQLWRIERDRLQGTLKQQSEDLAKLLM